MGTSDCPQGRETTLLRAGNFKFFSLWSLTDEVGHIADPGNLVSSARFNLSIQAAIKLDMFYRAGLDDVFIPFGKVRLFPIVAEK